NELERLKAENPAWQVPPDLTAALEVQPARGSGGDPYGQRINVLEKQILAGTGAGMAHACFYMGAAGKPPTGRRRQQPGESRSAIGPMGRRCRASDEH